MRFQSMHWAAALLLVACGGAGETGMGATPMRATVGEPTVVAQGLDNPRGLAFGPSGALYVAEAGRGGTGPCLPSPDAPPPAQVCFGATGAITRVWKGEQARVLSGLPSFANPDGTSATGPSDVSLLGEGQAYVSLGFGHDPALRAGSPQLSLMGKVLHLQRRHGGGFDVVADVAGVEAAENPDGAELNSNPNGIAAFGEGQVVADAGANSLILIPRHGEPRLLATFPSRLVPAPDFLGLPPGAMLPMQAVPTSVVRGPDGAFYVGQLTGFPFPVGGANVYRVVPGQAPEIYASGFTNIMDLAFDRSGRLYVLQISQGGIPNGLDGAILRVDRDGTVEPVVTSGLLGPGGLAIGRDGALYVTNNGVLPGAGQVLRYPVSGRR